MDDIPTLDEFVEWLEHDGGRRLKFAYASYSAKKHMMMLVKRRILTEEDVKYVKKITGINFLAFTPAEWKNIPGTCRRAEDEINNNLLRLAEAHGCMQEMRVFLVAYLL